MDHSEILIVGAGVVGLAIARELARAGRGVIVLEEHAEAGTETSSRNSEVIHAGLYYAPGSLKAQLCIAGRDALYAYCESRGVPHRRCGKLLVANGPAQERKLAAIAAQAERNGAPIERLTPAEARSLEPNVLCTAALFSPLTGIIDSHDFVQSLLGDVEQAGGAVALRTRFVRAAHENGQLSIETESGGERTPVAASWLINCGGLRAPRVASSVVGTDPRHVPEARFAKGNYFAYSGRPPFSHLVYPMPNEEGLGIHATLDLSGRVRFGPDVEWQSEPDYRVDPARVTAFVEAIREYWPAVEEHRLTPDYAGVRPKIVGEGQVAADFRIDGPERHGVAGVVHLFGIESPGLTAALAIAERVRRILDGTIPAASRASG